MGCERDMLTSAHHGVSIAPSWTKTLRQNGKQSFGVRRGSDSRLNSIIMKVKSGKSRWCLIVRLSRFALHQANGMCTINKSSMVKITTSEHQNISFSSCVPANSNLLIHTTEIHNLIFKYLILYRAAHTHPSAVTKTVNCVWRNSLRNLISFTWHDWLRSGSNNKFLFVNL